jgi:hypothetical protein
MLEKFGPSLYVAEGPTLSFYGFLYSTRTAVVRHIVSSNKIHHLFLGEWAERWPGARLYAPPSLALRKPAVHFHTDLRDKSGLGEGYRSSDLSWRIGKLWCDKRKLKIPITILKKDS